MNAIYAGNMMGKHRILPSPPEELTFWFVCEFIISQSFTVCHLQSTNEYALSPCEKWGERAFACFAVSIDKTTRLWVRIITTTKSTTSSGVWRAIQPDLSASSLVPERFQYYRLPTHTRVLPSLPQRRLSCILRSCLFAMWLRRAIIMLCIMTGDDDDTHFRLVHTSSTSHIVRTVYTYTGRPRNASI